jgi:Autographiviridae DNA primase/helicase
MRKHGQPCPDCGSSHALSIYEDGHTYCHKCYKHTQQDTQEEEQENLSHEDEEAHEEPANNYRRITPLAKNFSALGDRGIDQITAEKFQVKAVLNDEIKNVRHVYPYFDRDGNHIGNKLRTKFNKGFFVEGDIGKSALFGQNLFPPGGKSITIVEGECDAMAVYQMFGHKYPVVSVKSAATAVANVLDNYEYLVSFEKIVLVFDADKTQARQDGSTVNPGQDAAKAVAAILPLGKVRVVTLVQGKDANEYLQRGLSSDFQKEWWNAPDWTPAGIRLGKDLWEDIKTPKSNESINYPWDALNELTYGIRPSELVIVTAETGVGKTSVLKEIEHHLLANSPHSIGLLHLEESNGDTGLGLMSIEANKPLHLPDVRETVTQEELKAYYDKTINSERVIIYDHFGSNDITDLLNKIRHMAALGAKYIVLDHLSIVVSDQSGDERKQLDEISTKLKTLCMELNIAVLAVIHQNRNGQIRGTAGVEQLANIVIKLIRDREDDDPWRRNVTKVVIQKNRFSGKTGPAAYLYYNSETGRLEELDKHGIAKFESGASPNPDEQGWAA